MFLNCDSVQAAKAWQKSIKLKASISFQRLFYLFQKILLVYLECFLLREKEALAYALHYLSHVDKFHFSKCKEG